MIHTATMNVAGACGENHQFASFRLFVMLLPVKLGAGLFHGIAIKNPSQNAVHRLRCFVAEGPISVPLANAFSGGITLEFEDRQHE